MGDGEPAADGGVTELVRRCKAGDVATLEALYRRYVDRVWRLGWFWTHSGDEAADIVQETFLRVARSINRFEQRSAFSTWLFAIARSVAIEHLRKGRRDRAKADDPRIYRLVPPPAEPPDSLTDEETRQGGAPGRVSTWVRSSRSGAGGCTSGLTGRLKVTTPVQVDTTDSVR